MKFSSKEDLSEHSKSVEGQTTDSAESLTHVVPGDTVFFKLSLGAVTEGKPPQYCFTVTGTQLGRYQDSLVLDTSCRNNSSSSSRFETGFAILSCLLKELPELAPLSKLWRALVAVACQYAGKERLKVIGLLRKVLMLHHQG